MADDDIYKSKRKYETFVQHLVSFAVRPEERKQWKKTERLSFRVNRAWLSKIEGFAQQREDNDLAVIVSAYQSRIRPYRTRREE